MADKTQNVKTRLSFDGEAEYKAACKEINSTLKVLNSEMKLVTAEYKDNASSVDALKAKQAVLQKTYDEQAKKVKETEAALEKCRKATGDNSEESKKLETQLNYQKAALVKTEQELGKTTDEMEKAEKAADEMGKEIKDSGEQADDAKGKFSGFTSVLSGMGTALKAAAAATAAAVAGAATAIGALTTKAIDIYLNSDDGAKGLKSEYGCAPMTGTESMNWYNFVERLAKSGKRLPNYAEFCAYAFGSPAGLDNANTNAWSATSNTGRGVTGSVVNAVSSVGVVDAVGRVWEWLDELITRAEHATNADYHASVAWGWDKKSPLNTGEKSYDVGNIYQYYAYSLAALIAGGRWGSGADCGARAVHCHHYPWNVNTSIGARGACDSL